MSEFETVYRMSDRETERDVGAFTFRLTNADEAFGDLLADKADMVMSLREVRQEERLRAEEVGLGDLTGRNGSRVVALDALVPVVAPSNPITQLTVPQLSQLLSGEIDNWSQLGGADAPVSVHVHQPSSGLGQAMQDLLLEPAGVDWWPVSSCIRVGRTWQMPWPRIPSPLASPADPRQVTLGSWVSQVNAGSLCVPTGGA